MKQYSNYIFDLYGTLVDIRTDEEDPALWQWLSGMYACCGAFYGPGEIKSCYRNAVAEMESALGEKSGVRWPEIRLEDVFVKLLTDRKGSAECGCVSFDEGVHQEDLSTWVNTLSCGFRVFSRRWLHVYPDTVQTIKELKKRGCGVHLLSNAQAVFTRPELLVTGLSPLFDSIYISSDHGMKKPQLEFMEKLISQQGLDRGTCVMVGNDFQSDMAIAAACGTDSVFINTFGYSPEYIDSENTMGAAVIEHLSQLL